MHAFCIEKIYRAAKLILPDENFNGRESQETDALYGRMEEI